MNYPPKYSSKNVRNPLSVKKVAGYESPRPRRKPAPGAVQEALARMNKAAANIEKKYKMSLIRQQNGSLHPAVRKVIENKIRNGSGVNIRIPNGVPLPEFYDWYVNNTKANKVKCAPGTVFNPWTGNCVAPKTIRNTLVRSVRQRTNTPRTTGANRGYAGYLPGSGSSRNRNARPSTSRKNNARVMNSTTRASVQAYIRRLNKEGSMYELPNGSLPYPKSWDRILECENGEFFNPWTGKCVEKLKSIKNYAVRLAKKK